MQESILILDFGGQYSQLIARRIREDHVYCDILPYDTDPERIRRAGYKGLVLTGGPSHVNGDGAPRCDPSLFELDIPVLGICYGAQLMTMMLGGRVAMPEQREYGRVPLEITAESILFPDVPKNTTCWMSHADRIEQMPPGFCKTAQTKTCPVAAMECRNKALYAVQFHPEVQHTPEGSRILHRFLYDICGCTGQWRMTTFAKEAIQRLRERIGSGKVLCGISGGVDSSVAALLVHRAVGQQLTGVFVDHGFLRAGEADTVERVLKKQFDMNLVRVDASERFLEAISGVTDSEEKRKRIGECFIRVFEEEAKRIGDVDFLVQGTIYPDVIESGTGKSAVIKSHHNVGGLPSQVGFQAILEPLRDLFKDEVRQVGQALGLPESLVLRQPFPGPGLAIRIMGAVTAEKLSALRKADAIFTDEILKAGLDRTVHQYFAVLTGVRSVGVMGDERTYDQVVALRGVTTTDFMTADWARLPYDVLAKVSERVVNEVSSINRVVYDITSKPPATIEWE